MHGMQDLLAVLQDHKQLQYYNYSLPVSCKESLLDSEITLSAWSLCMWSLPRIQAAGKSPSKGLGSRLMWVWAEKFMVRPSFLQQKEVWLVQLAHYLEYHKVKIWGWKSENQAQLSWSSAGMLRLEHSVLKLLLMILSDWMSLITVFKYIIVFNMIGRVSRVEQPTNLNCPLLPTRTQNKVSSHDSEERYVTNNRPPSPGSVTDYYLLPDRNGRDVNTQSFESHELNSLASTPDVLVSESACGCQSQSKIYQDSGRVLCQSQRRGGTKGWEVGDTGYQRQYQQQYW